MITKMITKLLGDPNEKEIKKLRKMLPNIKAFQKEYEALDADGVKAKTKAFQERLTAGTTTTDELLPEAFGLVMRACEILKGQTITVRDQELIWEMIPYDVQLIGGMILHSGKIGEMKTGEGKTLVATLPLYLNALEGKGSFLVTVNEYLAHRDAEWMTHLYNMLGLTCGVIRTGQPTDEKRAAYACDITYGTNNEFGFDYLRDNMATSADKLVQRDLHYAIVDEVDSILIDEARTPLIISAPAGESTEKYKRYSQLVTQLRDEEHYTIDEKSRSCVLTDEGISKMEQLLGMTNIYTEGGASEVHHIEQALKAQTIFKKDIDYMVRDSQVIIIDEFTGRLMDGRRYSDGLHQAIEAKERVEIKQESKTLATITFQNLFRLFNKLAGMTGTAITEAEEFGSIYGLETIVIPTNRPIARIDANDLIYKSLKGKFQAVTAKVKELQEKGQPVLVGTISVEKSEILSQMFTQAGVKHEVLNAKHHEREAEIVANAGMKGSVTIATNMAGRGTDIKVSQEIKDLGGLYIIGTERHESRRIDNQLRGRSGRQGDPGYSQFFVSMDDELMRLFGGDRMLSIMETLKVPDDMPIENRIISRSIESAQKRVEGRNFDIRKHLVQYDDVMNQHRTIVYQRRNKFLKNENIHEDQLERAERVAVNIVRNSLQGKRKEDWNSNELFDSLHMMSGIIKNQLKQALPLDDEVDNIASKAGQIFRDALEHKRTTLGQDDTFFDIEKHVALRTVDRLWMDHIDSMVRLRQQVALRGYAQKDPLVEYKKDGFEKFEQLIGSIESDTIQTLLRMEFKIKVPQAAPIPTQTNADEITDIQTGDRELLPGTKPSVPQAKPATPTRPVIEMGPASTSSATQTIHISSNDKNSEQHVEKAGRNDPCPCGSGKKYKKCHGQA